MAGMPGGRSVGLVIDGAWRLDVVVRLLHFDSQCARRERILLRSFASVLFLSYSHAL